MGTSPHRMYCLPTAALNTALFGGRRANNKCELAATAWVQPRPVRVTAGAPGQCVYLRCAGSRGPRASVGSAVLSEPAPRSLQGLIIPRILEYSQEQAGGVGYAVGLCLALFATECLKSLSMCACWVVSQRTGIRFRAAAASLAFQKLLQFKSLMHITTGEVSAGRRPALPGAGGGRGNDSQGGDGHPQPRWGPRAGQH